MIVSGANCAGSLLFTGIGSPTSTWRSTKAQLSVTKRTSQSSCLSFRESSKMCFELAKLSDLNIQNCPPAQRPIRCSAAGRNGRRIVRSKDGANNEPFWLSLIRDFIWSLRYLAVFLVEQPSQLKYLEWPHFQSTLKTAMLTLVLVALLIVALSSIDAALCYLLALFLRKTA